MELGANGYGVQGNGSKELHTHFLMGLLLYGL